MVHVFGITDSNNVHTDVSSTLLGAKQYATRNGFVKVSKRVGYNASVVATKMHTGWVNT